MSPRRPEENSCRLQLPVLRRKETSCLSVGKKQDWPSAQPRNSEEVGGVKFVGKDLDPNLGAEDGGKEEKGGRGRKRQRRGSLGESEKEIQRLKLPSLQRMGSRAVRPNTETEKL